VKMRLVIYQLQI